MCDPSIEEWVSWFVATQDGDAQVATEAHAWINRQIQVSPDVLLGVACTVVMDASLPLVARQMASIAASYALNAKSERHLQVIRAAWESRPALALHVKRCLYATVLSADDVIRNQAARSFALVFGIEGDGFASALDHIAEILCGDRETESETVGLLAVFGEILNLPNFEALRTPALVPGYLRIWVCAVGFVGGAGVSVRVRCAAAQCVRDAIDALPDVCRDEADSPDVMKIRTVLSSIPPCLEVGNITLFQCCHRIMFNIVRQDYPVALEFIAVIWDFTVPTMALPADYQKAAIYLWMEIAQFEADVDPAASHKLVVTAGEPLLPMLFQIMCDVEADDTDVEDCEEQSPSMFATMAVAAFYEAAPADVFETFIEPTFRRATESNSWPVQHAALLLLYCVSHGPGHPELHGFVRDVLPLVFDACKRVEVPRIRETALFVLAMIIDAFKSIIKNEELPVPPSEFVRRVLDLLKLDGDPHPNILHRYTTILCYLAGVWPKLDPVQVNFRSPLPQFFEPIVNILKGIMSRPIRNEKDLQLYQSASESLNQVIRDGTTSKQTSLLKSLFAQTMMDLENARHDIEADNVCFAVQANLCSNLTWLTLQLGSSGFNDDELHGAIKFLFGVLGQRDTLIYEEALMAVSSLYIHLHDRFVHGELVMSIAFVKEALASGCPGVINSASLLLGDLFHFDGRSFLAEFHELFMAEATLLREHEEMQVTHPFCVKAIAEMLEGVVRHPDHVELVAEYEADVLALMKMVRAVPINAGDEADMQYANNLFENLAHLYRVFAKLFYPREQGQKALALEKEYLLEMATFSARIVKITPVSEPLLTQFVAMAEQFANYCTKKNNVVLNRASVHRVLDLGELPQYTLQVRQLCRNAIRKLKTR
jgi:hypothetical protein